MNAAQKLWSGTVRVRATGTQVERLINVSAAQGVTLNNVVREGGRALVFDVEYQGFYALRPAFRTCGCQVRILKRKGIPNLRARMRFRMLFAVGAVACLLAVVGMMQFVWEVRIIGDADVEQNLIAQEVLGGLGVRRGMMRGEVAMKTIEEAMLSEIGGLIFAGARMRGLVLEVEIISTGDAPRMKDIHVPVDVIADVAGIVESIKVLEGTAAVRVGQEVKPGDVLIQGVAIGPGGEIEVHAMGEVVVRVWIRGEGEAPLRQQVSEPTGAYVNRTTLMIMGLPMPIHGEAPFEEYALAARETPILPGLYLPAAVLTETLHEMKTYHVPRAEQEVRREAEQSAILEALHSLKGETTIVDKRVEYSKMKDTTLFVAVQLQVLRTIGVESAR